MPQDAPENATYPTLHCQTTVLFKRFVCNDQYGPNSREIQIAKSGQHSAIGATYGGI